MKKKENEISRERLFLLAQNELNKRRILNGPTTATTTTATTTTKKTDFLLKKDKGHGLYEFLFHRLAVDTNIWATFCMKICCQEL